MSLTAIEKTTRILKAFTPDNHPVRTIEISRDLNINKATVNRILNTLKREGFVIQDPLTRRYQLGPSAADLGRAIRQSLEGQLVSLAKPYLDRLRDRVGETVHLEVLSGHRVYLTYCAPGPRPVSVSVNLGDLMATNANAGAKAILAFSPPKVVEECLSSELKRFTANTITDPELLRSHLIKIRNEGVAFDLEEHGNDVIAVGAPIFDHDNNAVAAAVIIAPTYRVEPRTTNERIALLKNAAADISISLLNSEQGR